MRAARWAQGLNLIWITLYTVGLSAARRTARREEVSSDMHDEVEYGLATGEGAWALQREIASRTVRGAIGDILWRIETGREEEMAVVHGESPPLPWLSTLFLGGVITLGALSTIDFFGVTDLQNMTALAAIIGAALTMLGLYLVTHRWAGPLFIGFGTASIAWSLWWTFVAPIAAVLVAVAGVRRAHRIERLLDLD